MRSTQRIPGILIAMTVLLGLGASIEGQPATNRDRIQLVSRIKRSTLVVYATDADGNGAKGSAVAIQRLGNWVLCATNWHVVMRDDKFYRDKILVEPYEATSQKPAAVLFSLHSAEKMIDLAMICVQDPENQIRIAEHAEAETHAAVGDEVWACGNPLQEKFFVDHGNISRRDDYLLQHSALIEHGSSGGGLFDKTGRLIAINTWIQNDTVGIALEIGQFLRIFECRAARVSAQTNAWQDSGIPVEAGTRCTMLGLGSWTYSLLLGPCSAAGVDGYPEYRVDAASPHASLLVRIEDDAQIRCCNLVYQCREKVAVAGPPAGVGILESAPRNGNLQFRINDTDTSNNSGNMDVIVLTQRSINPPAAGASEPAWVQSFQRAERGIASGDYSTAAAQYSQGLSALAALPDADRGKLASDLRMRPALASVHYNLACILSLKSVGKSGPRSAAQPVATADVATMRDAAFDHLAKALAFGYGDAEHLEFDADLAPLHGDARWLGIVAQCRAGSK